MRVILLVLVFATSAAAQEVTVIADQQLQAYYAQPEVVYSDSPRQWWGEDNYLPTGDKLSALAIGYTTVGIFRSVVRAGDGETFYCASVGLAVYQVVAGLRYGQGQEGFSFPEYLYTLAGSALVILVN